MKVLIALLVCSLAANAAYFVVRARGSAPKSNESASPAASATPNVPAEQGIHKSDTERASAGRFFDLAHNDPKTLKEQLEAAGYPPHLVKAVITALISESSLARQYEILQNQKEVPFWQAGNHIMGNTNDPEAMRAVSALQRETSEQLRAVLGDTLWEESAAFAAQRQTYGDLPLDKIARLQRIQSDYFELQRQIAPVSPGTKPSPADQEKLMLLEKEKRADIEAALTPAELYEYDLRTSRTARQLSFTLDAFAPTEEEFRAIFPIQRAIDEAKSPNDNMPGVIVLSSNARDPELLAKLEGVLSPERLADLEFTSNSANAILTRLTNRLGLPLSAAKEVSSLRDSSALTASKLRADTTLSDEERTAQLKTLAQAASDRAHALLGPKGVEAYLQYGGSWLNSLAPSPTDRSSLPTR